MKTSEERTVIPQGPHDVLYTIGITKTEDGANSLYVSVNVLSESVRLVLPALLWQVLTENVQESLDNLFATQNAARTETKH